MTPQNKMIIANELRPCIVNGQKALFHTWVETENVILKFNGLATAETIQKAKKEFFRGGVISSEFSPEKIKAVVALVEYEDGQMDEVRPIAVRFVDNAHSDYDFKEREGP